MGDILKLSGGQSEAEILVFHLQLNALRRKSSKRLAFRKFDRLVFGTLTGQ
jgi:hypothetical protein